MTSKIFWFDTESSGINAKTNAVLQLAGLIEIDDSIKKEIYLKMKPIQSDIIDPKALEMNHITLSEIEKYPETKVSILELKKILRYYVNPYTKTDKYIAAGYNIGFDMDMLRATFSKVGDAYFGSWFFWPKIDVQTLVAYKISKGLRLPNYQLGTVCKHYSIEINAHNPTSDIKATRNLYRLLRNMS